MFPQRLILNLNFHFRMTHLLWRIMQLPYTRTLLLPSPIPRFHGLERARAASVSVKDRFICTQAQYSPHKTRLCLSCFIVGTDTASTGCPFLGAVLRPIKFVSVTHSSVPQSHVSSTYAGRSLAPLSSLPVIMAFRPSQGRGDSTSRGQPGRRERVMPPGMTPEVFNSVQVRPLPPICTIPSANPSLANPLWISR